MVKYFVSLIDGVCGVLAIEVVLICRMLFVVEPLADVVVRIRIELSWVMFGLAELLLVLVVCLLVVLFFLFEVELDLRFDPDCLTMLVLASSTFLD